MDYKYAQVTASGNTEGWVQAIAFAIKKPKIWEMRHIQKYLFQNVIGHSIVRNQVLLSA